MILNTKNIPTMSVYWTHENDFLGYGIRLCRGGFGAMADQSFPNHAGIFTRDSGVLFGTEETGHGLDEDSLTHYDRPGDRIISVYYAKMWDDIKRREDAQQELAEIRAEHGPSSRYNFGAIFAELPIVGKLFQGAWKSKTMICSQSVAYIHRKYGALWLPSDHIAPDQLMFFFQRARKVGYVECVLNYYL